MAWGWLIWRMCQQKTLCLQNGILIFTFWDNWLCLAKMCTMDWLNFAGLFFFRNCSLVLVPCHIPSLLYGHQRVIESNQTYSKVTIANNLYSALQHVSFTSSYRNRYFMHIGLLPNGILVLLLWFTFWLLYIIFTINLLPYTPTKINILFAGSIKISTNLRKRLSIDILTVICKIIHPKRPNLCEKPLLYLSRMKVTTVLTININITF